MAEHDIPARVFTDEQLRDSTHSLTLWSDALSFELDPAQIERAVERYHVWQGSYDAQQQAAAQRLEAQRRAEHERDAALYADLYAEDQPGASITDPEEIRRLLDLDDPDCEDPD